MKRLTYLDKEDDIGCKKSSSMNLKKKNLLKNFFLPDEWAGRKNYPQRNSCDFKERKERNIPEYIWRLLLPPRPAYSREQVPVNVISKIKVFSSIFLADQIRP